MKKLQILIFVLAVGCSNLYGQRTHGFEIKFFGGRIIPHRAGMDNLARPTLAGEINYYYSTRSDNYFDVKYRFPRHGFGLNYNYIWNHDVLGSALSAYSFMDFSFFDKQKFGLGMRVNAGLAYLTRKYDRENKPENIAISTNLCFYFNISVNAVFKLPSDIELRISPGFLHYSNGAVLKPNLGLNDVHCSIALSKNIWTSELRKERTNYQDKLSSHEAWIMGTCATSDEYSVGYEGRGGGFICSTVAAGYCYQYGKIGKVGMSIDMFYNENNKYFFFNDDRGLFLYYDKFSEIIKFGISAGHQLVYKRFELMTYLGVYFYNKAWAYDWAYTRIGARYYVTDFLFINLSLHANGFKARFIESGIGFSWRRWHKNEQ